VFKKKKRRLDKLSGVVPFTNTGRDFYLRPGCGRRPVRLFVNCDCQKESHLESHRIGHNRLNLKS
jgi:hypothetical protein